GRSGTSRLGIVACQAGFRTALAVMPIFTTGSVRMMCTRVGIGRPVACGVRLPATEKLSSAKSTATRSAKAACGGPSMDRVPPHSVVVVVLVVVVVMVATETQPNALALGS